tara:strand:- start:77 stop:682 length:606 start_codon:yes stop_codon:yes gene_type:complete
MKKLLLTSICLITLLISCVDHLDDAKLIYQQGITERSKDILQDAVLEADMIKSNHKNYEEAQKLIIKIDSVILSWEQEELTRLKREEERLNLLNKSIEDSLKRLDRKYPNLIGRWVLNETNYLSTLNSIVRIYKKGEVYYQSMVFEKDRSESILKLKKLSDKRYDVIGKSDYNIINEKGELEFWDKQGYFLTCKKRIFKKE